MVKRDILIKGFLAAVHWLGLVSMIKLNPLDNVALAVSDGYVPRGHKIALSDIKKGAFVIKYGFPIGVATTDIKAREHVHVHNLKSAISQENAAGAYITPPGRVSADKQGSFMGYTRIGGRVGIRNEIWIINTVGCTNQISLKIAERANKIHAGKIDGVYAVTHPYGCSQLGDDHENTREILAGYALHPNAGGVLVLGLGCENNTVSEFKNALGDYDETRIRFLCAQECEDETAKALEIIGEIIDTISCKRVAVGLDRLVIGLKCGGSDAFSGITANPLVGLTADRVCGYGGTAVLTETPEMFGAEAVLLNRCINENVFNETIEMIDNFKRYFVEHGQEVYENPSPGNKDGGITTLEEKSLGCVQKSGTGPIIDTLRYGGRVRKNGLVLLDGPGNDIVSTAALTAAGCQLILFTTGRGTPLGAFAPTIKISSNSNLARKKPHWIDYDAGGILSKGMDEAERELWDLIIAVAEGEIKTQSEIRGFRDFAIFKNGVTL